MSYDYIKRTYRFQPKVGGRVQHTVTNRIGTITRESKSAGHYVQVRFDGQAHASSCHPMELAYIGGAISLRETGLRS